jgi:hypothetical protein
MKKPKQRRKKKKLVKKLKKKPKTRVKAHKGPFQIELPLQMPLFPL